MGVIQREIERAGIATTSISLLRRFTERVRPPRALWVPFPFGRPLGAPNDAGIQRLVLKAALDLVRRPTAPILEDFDLPSRYERLDAKYQAVGRKCGPKGCNLEDILTASETATSPDPTIAHYDNNLESVLLEIAELGTAHRMYRERYRNRTQVGQSGISPETIAQAAKVVHEFVQGRAITLPAESAIAGGRALTQSLFVRLLIDDLKAYYLESRLAQAGHAADSATEANDWLWLDTRVSSLLVAARDRLIETTDRNEDPNWILARGIVPRGYGSGGYTMTHVLEEG